MTLETLILVLPLFTAFLMPILNIFDKRFGRLINIISYLAGIAVAVYLLLMNFYNPAVLNIGGWNKLFAINLYYSPLSLTSCLLIYIIAFLININSSNSKNNNSSYYNLLYQLFIFANLGLILTADFFNMFVMFEIASIASIALIAKGGESNSAPAAFKYILISSIASMAMLASVGLLYSAVGTLNIAKAAGIMMGPYLSPLFGLLVGIGILSLILYHTEILPFGVWVPDAYKGADYSFTASLVGIGGLSGSIVLARLWMLFFNGSETIFLKSLPVLTPFIIILGIISILFGELSALREKNIKRLLGFSSVGQMGVILIAIAVGTELSIKAALFLIAAHTLAKVLLILIAQFFSKVAGSNNWRELNGIARSYPLLGGGFVIGALSLMGIPLMIGFVGKISLLLEMIKSFNLLYISGIISILTASVIEGFYFMRMSHRFFEGTELTFKKHNSVIITLTVVIFAVVIIAIGLYPDLVKPFIDRIAADITNFAVYINNIGK
jgi:formate hydrogenlyase subunit 3/multisubunit Na+/H+ antiporter MnhD subunit